MTKFMEKLKKQEDKGFVILSKNRSKFINCYNEDAIILNYLLDYKILEHVKVGFPVNSIDKVINKLEESNINYKVLNLGRVEEVKDYKKLNKYDNVFTTAKNKLDIDNRITLIVDKIKNCTPEELEHILEVIEECIK